MKDYTSVLITVRATYHHGYFHLDYFDGDNSVPGISQYAVESVETIDESSVEGATK